MFFLIADPFNTGDFTYSMSADARKYEKHIKKGISYWADLNVGGIHLSFKTQADANTVLAKNVGNTIYINPSVFDARTDNIKNLTIAHEVGHALGIGKWPSSAVLTAAGGQLYLSPSLYPKTAKAYIDHYRPAGVTLPGPPIETQGDAGTVRVHWEDNTAYGMQRSIMIGTVSSNATLITFVDLAYLEEIGRKVDTSKGQKLTFFLQFKELIFAEEKFDCGCRDHIH